MRHPFSLTRSDRRSVIALSFIALACVAGMVLFGTDPTAATSSATDSLSVAHDNGDKGKTVTSSPSYQGFFDPNTVDSATLVRIGISPRRIHTFMRYRSAGARFSRPEDIARCYSFSDQDIDLMLPLIRISPAYRNANDFTRTKYPLHEERTTYPRDSSHAIHVTAHASNKFSTLTPVDINTADTALLRRIPGVGEAISSMIINMRDKLGGFTSVSQLAQIHQITPELYEWFTISDTIPFRKIQINKASFKTLVSHPYINQDQTNGILHYIRIYGPIPDIKTLQSAGIFKPDELSRLAPYLQF